MERLFKDNRFRGIVLIYMVLFLLVLTPGCSELAPSDVQQVRRFEIAGQSTSGGYVDGNFDKAEIRIGPYRVVSGDVLEFQMPAILRTPSLESSDIFQAVESYLCRVSGPGTIAMPIVGEINVAGRTLAEIEELVAEAYFPKYLVTKPAVVCKIEEHVQERSFTVTGLVNKPGVFSYPLNVQYSLMDALAFAGGTNMVADPHYVKIHRRDSAGKVVSAIFKIDKKSLADSANVLIRPGDIVSAEITPRTKTNLFLSDIFRISVGASFRTDDL
jgi:protein involved in polysaccharide export with SLBB domain